MKPTAYPVAGKRKSADICRAFAESCDGALMHEGPLREGPAFFYGVDASNLHVWRAAKARGDFLYCDNSYFDATRGTHFRITRNALQHSGEGASNLERFLSLGIPVEPWKSSGAHVVVCPQSDSFMRDIVGFDGDWLELTRAALRHFTTREVRVREWNRDKKAAAATLPDDLRGAHALVTHSSAAAITAVIAGVPVVCTGACAASRYSTDLASIESPPRLVEREQWLGVLADNQWTIDEIKAGKAWRALQ